MAADIDERAAEPATLCWRRRLFDGGVEIVQSGPARDPGVTTNAFVSAH